LWGKLPWQHNCLHPSNGSGDDATRTSRAACVSSSWHEHSGPNLLPREGFHTAAAALAAAAAPPPDARQPPKGEAGSHGSGSSSGGGGGGAPGAAATRGRTHGPTNYELAAEKMSDRQILSTLATYLWPKGAALLQRAARQPLQRRVPAISSRCVVPAAALPLLTPHAAGSEQSAWPTCSAAISLLFPAGLAASPLDPPVSQSLALTS
jgi:hypothetical protein